MPFHLNLNANYASFNTETSEQIAQLTSLISAQLDKLSQYLCQDLTYLPANAEQTGKLIIRDIIPVSENRYRLKYQFNWQALQACSGIIDTGSSNDSCEFTLMENGETGLVELVFA